MQSEDIAFGAFENMFGDSPRASLDDLNECLFSSEPEPALHIENKSFELVAKLSSDQFANKGDFSRHFNLTAALSE